LEPKYFVQRLRWLVAPRLTPRAVEALLQAPSPCLRAKIGAAVGPASFPSAQYLFFSPKFVGAGFSLFF